MTTIPVKFRDATCPITIGRGMLSRLPAAVKRLKLGEDALIITNPRVHRLHGRDLEASFTREGFSVKVLMVADSERSKSMATAMRLIGAVARYAADKRPFIVALGGGVVGDVAGFVAAVYKRGIPLVQVPTTLLAQIDSAIGGKVAVDLPEGKNLVGSFYQPRLVWADVATLSTLNDRQVRNGLAEAVKYGVISDPLLFAFIEKHAAALLRREGRALERLVGACAAIKARIVEKDEKETLGLRTILNFGHTVGHAVEAAGAYGRYHHGEAVALGMRAACRLSLAARLMDAREALRVELLLDRIGLPRRISGIPLARIMRAMKYDKKFFGKKNRFVLARGIGRVAVIEDVPGAVVAGIVRGLLA